MIAKIKNFVVKHPIVAVIFLVVLAGVLSMYGFFSGEYLFYFTGLADDSCCSQMISAMQAERLSSDGGATAYTFTTGMGDAMGSGSFNVEPISFVVGWIKRFVSLFISYDASSRSVVDFYFQFLVSFLGTALFTFLWLRTLNVSKYSSVLCSLIMAFSSSIVVLSLWRIETFGFNLAFYLFAFEQLLVKKRPYFFPFAVLMFASSPFFLYLASLFLFIYMIMRFVVIKAHFKTILSTCIWIFVMGLAGMLVGFPDIINSLITQLNTPRFAGNVGFSTTAPSNILLTSTMAITTILRFFAHDIPGNDFSLSEWNNYLEAPAFYTGLLTLLLLPQIFQFLNRRKQIAYGSFLAFWVAVMIFPPLRRAIVLYAGDYYRYGIDFFITFAMIFVAAQSLSLIENLKRISVPILAGSLAVCIIALYGAANSELMVNNSTLKSNVVYFVIVFLVLHTGVLMWSANCTNRQLFKIVQVVLVMIEVTFLTYSSFDGRDTVSKMEFDLNRNGIYDGTEKIVAKVKATDTAKFFRMEKDYKSSRQIHSNLNEASALGYFGTKNYSSFNQPYYVKFLSNTGHIAPHVESETRWISGFGPDPLGLSFAGIKYYLTKTDTMVARMPICQPFDTINGIHVIKVDKTLPLGFTVDRYIKAADFKKLISFHIEYAHIDNAVVSLDYLGVSPAQKFEIVENLRKLVGRNFNDADSLYMAVRDAAPDVPWMAIAQNLYHSSINNFMANEALLASFVYEEESGIDTTLFTQLDINNTNVITPVEQFSTSLFDSLYNYANSESLVITDFRQDNINGYLNVSKDKFLVLTIPYDKNWTLTLDGEEKELKLCDFGFSGAEIPAGNHTVELLYQNQTSKKFNTIKKVLVVLLWVAVVGIIVYRRKKGIPL
ncbi:MAG: YfhO family protein [Bacteroidales bacterium]|nr:YfhO family protein [Bacteroidales bacterium]